MDTLVLSPGVPGSTRVQRRTCEPSWWFFAEFEGLQMRTVLGERNIGVVFRFLRSRGWSVCSISGATGIPENQVRKIMAGHQQVRTYDVLERVAAGLDIPRGLMGMAYTPGVAGGEG